MPIRHTMMTTSERALVVTRAREVGKTMTMMMMTTTVATLLLT